MTVDEANGIAFVNFGSPRFDFYGGDRKGGSCEQQGLARQHLKVRHAETISNQRVTAPYAIMRDDASPS